MSTLDPTVVSIVLLILSLIYFLFNRFNRTNNHRLAFRINSPPLRLDRQGIELADQPGVYRSALTASDKAPITYRAFDEVKTLYDAFLRGLTVSKNARCLGYRPAEKQPYTFLSYADVLSNATDFASALIGRLEQPHGNATHIGVYSKNCPEWLITALACVQQSIVIVPLYDTLGADAASFIINQTEMSVVVVDTRAKAQNLLEKSDQMPSLRHLIIIETGDDEVVDDGGKIRLHSYRSLLKWGSTHRVEPHLPAPDDTYIICYTSGTTGLPKGVIITHGNIIANLSSFVDLLTKFTPQTISFADDNQVVLISYLPLSHMMEQMCHWCGIMVGARIGYFRGNLQLLTDDMKALRPTVFPVVPRLLNRFYDAIETKLANAGILSRWLFRLARGRKLAEIRAGIVRNDSIWDRLVFRRLQREIGGRVQYMMTGSAPIRAEVLETCRAALGAIILEFYGQTECCAIASYSWPTELEGGHCGGPATCALLKLADVPELEYWSKNGQGEVMVKGPSVTKGYYKDPVKTAELFDADGFLHTGDIGQMLPNGTIRIFDRKKHIFKLAQGEYVAPEKIENVLMQAPIIAQLFVDGDSLERFLVAIVVPDTQKLKDWYRAHVHDNGCTLDEICASKETRAYVLAELNRIGKACKLNSIEQVKAVHITNDAFTVENGLLTPTLKAKRPQLRKHFADIIKKLYDDNRQQ